jgi:cytochrome c-type biogenesis protein CcmH/NrfF
MFPLARRRRSSRKPRPGAIERRVNAAWKFIDTGLLATAAVLALLVALFAPPRDANAAPATSRREIAAGLTCQCGCGLTVANCNHPNCSFSVPTRERIDAMLAHGMGGAEIIAYFRKQYGEKILSAPTTQGFDLLAWTMPFIALLAGGGIIVLVMDRWRTRGAMSSDSPDAPAPVCSDKSNTTAQFDRALRERLERELKERI